MRQNRLCLPPAVLAATVLSIGASVAYAASGAWSGAADAAWINDANWSAAPYPSGADTASFTNAGSGNTTIDVSGLVNIKTITFDNAGVAPYTIGSGGPGAQTLVMTNAGLFQVTSTSWNDQLFNAAIQLGMDRAGSGYSLRNDSTLHALTVAGAIAPATSGGTAGGKSLAILGTGNVALTGGINRGGASAITVTNALTAGTLTLSGVSNGVTTLYLTGNANNSVAVGGGGLFLNNVGAVTLYSTQGGTLDGSGKIWMSTLNGQEGYNYADCYVAGGKTLVINNEITGLGGFEVWSGTGTFVFNGLNTFAGHLNIGAAGAVSVATIGNRGSASNVGKGTKIRFGSGGSKLIYTGAGETTDRIIDLNASGVIDQSGSGTLAFSAPPIFTATAAATLTLQGSAAGAGELSGIVSNGTAGIALTKAGTGTWTLSGANRLTGNVTVSGGTLRLAGAAGALAFATNYFVSANAVLLLENAAAANNSDRLRNASPVTLSGGTLAFSNDGSSASFSETAGALVVNSGAATVSSSQAVSGQTSSLTFSSLSRNGTATIDFAGSGLGASDRNRIFITGQPNGVIGPWATVNGTDFAAYDSALGVVPAGTSGKYVDIAARAPSTITHDPASSVRINTAGVDGPIALGSATTAISTLLQNTATDATVDTASKAFQVDNIVIPATKAAVTVGAAANDGSLAPATSGGGLLLVNESAASLTVKASIADNGAAASLTAYGSGKVVLAGSNTFSGTAASSGAALALANTHALQNSTLASAATFDASVASHEFLLGGLSGSFNLALADDDASPNPVALTVGNNGANTTASGVLSGSGSLTKSGPGTLTLSGANTYSGGTTVSGGTLTAASAGALGTGAVIDDATLNLTAANVTYSGLSTALSGTGTVNVTLGATTTTAYLNGDCSAFTGVWNIGMAGSGGKIQMNGADNPAALYNVLSNGTLWCNGTASHAAGLRLFGGNNGESYGQLRLEDAAVWAGPVALAGDSTDSNDGFFGGTSGTGVVSGVVSDLNGAHAVARVGANGRTYLTCPTNTYAGATWVRSGSLGAYTLRNVGQASSLGQPPDAAAGTIKISNGGTPARLTYTGTGDTSDRIIDLAGTTGEAFLEQAGSGTLTLTSGLGLSGAGSKNLNLEGWTDSVGEFAGVISNTASGTLKSLTKQGSGTWVLSAENTYTGTTIVTTGKLVAAHPKALGSGPVNFPGASTATLELSNSGAGERPYFLLMNAGAVGTFMVGSGGSSEGINHTLGDSQLSTVTLQVRRSAEITSGSPALTMPTVNLSSGSAGTTTLSPLDADLHIGSVAILLNSNAKTLKLDGTNAFSSVDGSISNGINTLTVLKDNASVWTLFGSNSYSGATTVNGGTLVHKGQHTGGGATTIGTNALYVMAGLHSGGGAVAVNGGALEITGTSGAVTAASGITVSQNGTLTLANSADSNRADRLGDTVPVTLAGGSIRFSHPADAASYAETLGTLALAIGSNTVASSQAAEGQTSALTLAALSPLGGSVDFVGTDLGLDARNQVLVTAPPVLSGGIIGPWATVNGGSYATYGAFGVTAATVIYTDIAARGPGSVIPDDAEAHARIVADGVAGDITLAADVTNRVSTLKQTNVTVPATVSLTDKALLTSGLQIASDGAALTVGSAADDGALATLTPGGTLSLINQSTNALTVNAAVADNAGTTLFKDGAGAVVLEGTASHTGPTAINGGVLCFASELPQALPGTIGGSGTLVKDGASLLHLLATNTYTGPTAINAGTVRANQNATFGLATGGGVTIADGATLDIGCTPDVGGTRIVSALDFGAKLFTVQGNGVGGQGAIINSATGGQQNAFEKIALAGPTRFGGVSRWDIRGGTFAMNGYDLTKVGPGSFMLVGTVVTPGEANIDVASGTVRLETSTTLNGSSANTLTIRSGAKLESYQMATPIVWSLVLEGNSTNDAAYNSTASTQNRWNGPVSLLGPVAFGGNNSGYYGTLAGDITGSGPVTKYGTSTITFAGTNNTYTGATRIFEGTLAVPALRNVGEPSPLGQPANAVDGTISLGNGTTAGTLLYTGAGDTTDRIIDLAGTTGGAVLNQSGTGPLRLTSNFSYSGVGNKTVTLRGVSAALCELAIPLVNGGVGSTNTLTKQDGGTWLLSANNGFTGAMNVNGGTLLVSGTNTQGAGNIVVGNLASSNAVLRLLPSANITGTGGFYIGNAANSAAAVYLTGGVVARTPSAGDSNFGLGLGGGTYGYFNMSDGTVTNARLNLGGTATAIGMGLARITSGSLRFSEYLLLARTNGCVGVLTLDGGTLNRSNATANISIAHSGGRGELNLTGGVIDNTGRAVAIRQNNMGSGSTGVVNICAGSLTLNAFQNTAGTAWLNFNGGTLRAATASTAFIPGTLTRVTVNGQFGSYAGGATIDTAGKNVTVAAPLQAPAGNGVASIVLATQGSGYIGEPYVAIAGGGGEGATAVANMTDDGTGKGTLKVASVTVTTPGWNYAGAPYVAFSGGGAGAVQATASGVTLAANTSGGLTKTGEGVLTLSAANTYSGMTTISNGTLRLGLANALPPNAPVTLVGGTYDLGGFDVTNTLTYLSGAITNGTFRMDLSPAGEGTVGEQGVTAQAGATIQGTYYADVTPDGSSDLVTVTGGIDLGGLTLQLVDPDALDRRKQYTVMSVTGARTGTFASTNLPDSRWHVYYLADGTVKIAFSDGTVLKIK